MPKFRQMYNKFVAEGDKVCQEFFNSNKYPIEAIYITPEYSTHAILPSLQSICQVISHAEMAQISSLKTPSPLLIVLRKPQSEDFDGQLPARAIYLDGIQDPGNLGTIIRVADWFGIDTVIRSAETTDFYNPKTVQATMGSIVNVKLFSSSIAEISSWQLPLIGTDMNGEILTTFKLPSQGILIMGSEGKGMADEVKSHLSSTISIPGNANKIAESLNVAIATGIICSHWK
jgi:RNA methyltransferase, TrmH family